MANYCWLASSNSSINFWKGNWLGYIILDKITVDVEVCSRIRAKILDFRINDSWYIPEILSSQYPDICNDIRDYVLGEEDKLIWKLSIDGNASYSKIYGSKICLNSQYSWAKLIWAEFIPPRQSILVWKILHKRLATEEELQSRGFHMASCFRLR